MDKVYELLKGFFQGREADFKQVLQGLLVRDRLHFPHNQNKLVEVFRRLKYNRFISSNKKEIERWLCKHFSFPDEKDGKKEVKPFNSDTVYALLSGAKGEPPPSERICNVHWLPHKTHAQLRREKKEEPLR
jgi:hypothetical protein